MTGLLPSVPQETEGDARCVCVWRRQGETIGRVSNFPNMVVDTDTTREWRAAD